MIKDIDTVVDFTNLYTSPTSQIVVRWIQLFVEGGLTQNVLWDHWYDQVPTAYLSQFTGNLKFLDASEPVDQLVAQLTEFVYNGQSEPINKLIRSLGGGLDQLCGKVFRTGEPSYSCRECGSDGTSVLCVECFLNSAHREHRYKMATSSGGGFCDCGDPEAWINNHHCDIHKPSGASNFRFPLDFYRRCTIAFQYSLNFVVEVLNKNYHSINGPAVTINYALVMYNDEVHSFNQVINILVKVVSCSQREALTLASKINRDGRAVVALSPQKRLSKMKTTIEHLSSTNGIRPLDVRVVPFNVVACQQFASQLLKWALALTRMGVEFRTAFVEALQTETKIDSTTLLDQILLQDPSIWKLSKIQWHSLICSSMLVDSELKRILACRFLKNYSKIVTNYVDDDDSLTYSVHCFSVQLYTAPSIAKELIEKYDAVKIAIDAALDMTKPYINSEGKFEFGSTGSDALYRACCPLQDVKYLLGTVLESTPDLICGFVDGVNSLLTVLGYAQGMNPITRQLGSHVEFEPEWETGFKWAAILYPVVDLVVKWCSTNDGILNEIYHAVLSKIRDVENYSSRPSTIRIFGNFKVDTLRYDAVVDSVSLHLPLTRFWAELYSLRRNSNSTSEIDDDARILHVIEPIFRTHVMLAQFRSGMWKKNGNSLSGQIYYYHNPKFRARMLEKGVLAIQIAASKLDPDSFLVHALSKFELLDWTFNHLKSPLPEIDSYQLNSLVDEFLYLIILVTSERYVGRTDEMDQLSNSVVHQLALKPSTIAELVKTCSIKNDDNLIEIVVERAAQFKTTEPSTGKGHYDLKDDDYPRNFNPYHLNYSKENSFKSEQNMKRRYKLTFCPPPELPPFSELFARTTDLLKSDVLLQIVNLVLNRWISSDGVADYDGQVNKALFLVGLALREEKATDRRFGYVVKAKNWNVDSLLVDIYNDVMIKEHKDLVEWNLKLYAELTADEDILKVLGVQNDKVDDQNVKRKLLAEKAKADIMAKMKSMQEQFSESNTCNSNDFEEGEFSQSHLDRIKTVTCIMCQEDENLNVYGRTMILTSFVQNSAVHRNQSSDGFVHISTCGHIMHADCWNAWTAEFIRKRIFAPFSYNLNDKEYFCPLCQCIGNSAIPMMPEHSIKNSCDEQKLSFVEWFRSIIVRLFPSKVSDNVISTEDDVGVDRKTVTYGDHEWTVEIPGVFQNESKDSNSMTAAWIIKLSDVIADISKDNTVSDGVGTSPLCDSIAYTILSTERCLARSDKPLFGSLKTREEDGLDNLIRAVPFVKTSNKVLAAILSDEPSKASILNCNSFSLLINSLADNYQFNSDHNKRCLCCVETLVYRLFVIRQIAQFLLMNPLREGEDSNEDTKCLLPLANLIRRGTLSVNSSLLWDQVKSALIPFLRCCAIFRHFSSRSIFHCDMNRYGGDTYDNLCKYLRLPTTCYELLDNEETRALFTVWSSHPDVLAYCENYHRQNKTIEMCLGTKSKLVDLPDDYCDILNSLVTFHCPNSDIDDDSSNPTMCLICGNILCSLSYCCQKEIDGQKVGACNYHSRECGKGVGIFLRLRECRLMLFASFERGCFSTPPYVDKHGEPDEGLRRGNPLKLCRKSYSNLELIWLNHGIHEKVTRNFDSNTINIIRWQFI